MHGQPPPRGPHGWEGAPRETGAAAGGARRRLEGVNFDTAFRTRPGTRLPGAAAGSQASTAAAVSSGGEGGWDPNGGVSAAGSRAYEAVSTGSSSSGGDAAEEGAPRGGANGARPSVPSAAAPIPIRGGAQGGGGFVAVRLRPVLACVLQARHRLADTTPEPVREAMPGGGRSTRFCDAVSCMLSVLKTGAGHPTGALCSRLQVQPISSPFAQQDTLPPYPLREAQSPRPPAAVGAARGSGLVRRSLTRVSTSEPMYVAVPPDALADGLRTLPQRIPPLPSDMPCSVTFPPSLHGAWLSQPVRPWHACIG